MCDVNTDQGNYLANVTPNGIQSKWWLEFEVNTSLNMKRHAALTMDLGILRI